MFNCHYVPKLILRNFGDNFDVYETHTGRLLKGLNGTEGFVKKGLYDDDIEILLDTEIENNFPHSLSTLQSGIGPISVEEAERQIRKYLAISYIRTLYFRLLFKRDKWNDILRSIITGKMSLKDFISGNDTYHTKLLSVILDGTISFVSTGPECQPFLISDKGVTFIDGNNAIYPYSKHDAIWISKDADGKKGNITEDDVLSINDVIMMGTYKVLGMGSVDEMLKSILHYTNKNPDDARYSNLLSIVDSMSFPGAESYNQTIRENSGIADLCIPKKMMKYIENGVTPDEISALADDKQFYILASIEVLSRFGILEDGCSAGKIMSERIPDEKLRKYTFRYVENARSEYDKCTGVIFLEAMSERGDGPSSDRLRRYYQKGKHVIKDLEKSDYYLRKGCEQGYNDCLAYYYKTLMDDPDYEEKVRKYRIKNVKGGSAVYLLAMLYREHGDLDNYLLNLERGVDIHYGPAIAEWANYWVVKKPPELNRIKEIAYMTLERQLEASLIIAKFYRRHEDLCPGMFEWYMRELKASKSIHFSQICLQYRIDMDDF